MPGKSGCGCSFAGKQFLFLGFGLCCIVSFCSSLAPIPQCWRSSPVSTVPPGQCRCLCSGGRQCPEGSGCLGQWGRVPRGWGGAWGRSPGSALQLRHGAAGWGWAVANAWHSWCISGTVLCERGNQEYLLPREAQRVTGMCPALSHEAVTLPGEALSHQSWAQLRLQLRCERGAGSSAGGMASAGG